MRTTSLIRLEADDPTIGGLAITYPSGACKSASWKSEAPITDPLAMSKQLAAKLLEDCLRERRIDDAERTNWPSVTAAAQRIVMEFSELRRRRLYAAVDNVPVPAPSQPTNDG